MIGADVVADILAQENTEYVFGFPENRIIDSAAALGIRPIIARTERVAINMADGYSRLNNGSVPAVVAVQDGPGIESSFGAIAQAHADGTPLFAIPGAPWRAQQGYAPQFSAAASLKSIAKWTSSVADPANLVRYMEQALTRTKTGPKGVVLLEIAKDILWNEFVGTPKPYRIQKSFRSCGDAGDIAETVDALLRAKRPVIIAGNGVHYAEAWAELKEFAELVNVPVMTTLLGKSAFPEDHLLSLGTGGRSMPDTVGHFATKADLILGIGTSFTINDFTARMPLGVTLAQITHDPDTIGKCYPVSYGAIGDAKLVLSQLISKAKQEPGLSDRQNIDFAPEISSVRSHFLKRWANRLTDDSDGPISPYRVVAEIDRVFDKACTIITHDSGNPRDQLVPFYRATEPRGYLSWGKSTHLGSSLGLIMGAKLARPKHLCVNLVGDTGFGQFGIDHETAVRCNIPILTVLMNNGVMGGYGAHMPKAVEKYSANTVSGNYRDLCQALGAHSQRVSHSSELALALTECASVAMSGRPAVLEVITKEDPVLPLAENWGM